MHPYREPAARPLGELAEQRATVSRSATGAKLAAASSLALAFGLAVAACTPAQRQGARTVLDVAQVLCVIANQALPEGDVARVCGITGPLIGPMRDVLAGARTASARAAAQARTATCADAGAADAASSD